jgi:hypothetical protein
MPFGRPQRIPLAALLALLPSCATAPLGEAPHFSSQTVSITEKGLLPGAELRIADFGTVVFRNARAAGDVAVEIARPFAPSAQCSTTLRFAARGEASASMPIAPREVASICFHQGGRFPFTVKSDDGTWSGVVVVGGAQ